jgi:hypothetical protein
MRCPYLRWVPYALIVAGIALIGLGLSSCDRYYREVRTGPPIEDADGDVRPYLTFKTFFLCTCGGVIVIASGLCLRKAGQHRGRAPVAK